jgi:protein-tyrosine phosphatase
VIDLHCHILPGLDDGPANEDFSLAMARAAVDAGIQLIVATPHVRSDYQVDLDEIASKVDSLNAVLESDEVPLMVMTGGEVALPKIPELGDRDLAKICLGRARHLLVESPYRRREIDIEGILTDLQRRGFKPVLAHPERCPIFRSNRDLLATLVERGVLCSITAASLAGGFGEPVRRFALEMLRDGLVHSVASDAHDHLHRRPELISGFEAAEEHLPGVLDQVAWYTTTAPVAILAGRPLPARPEPPSPRQASRWRRLVERLR